MPETPPDVEGALRAYLKQYAAVTALVNQRVFFGADDPTYPWIGVGRIGGGPVDGTAEGLLDAALLQIDCWGEKHHKAQAWAVTSAVLVALTALRRWEWTDADGGRVLLHTAVAQSWPWLPTDDRARYAISVEIHASRL